MWVYQLDTLAFLAVNNAAVARYDYRRDEFLAMTLHDIRPEAERSRLAQHMDKAEQGSRSPGLWRHRRKDGWLMTVEISSHALAFGSRHTRLVLAHDVSEREAAAAEKEGLNAELDQYRHHLEELVAMRTAELAAKRRQAEKANRAKSHFLTNMCHEIRTPMNPIIGLNQPMRRDGATPEQVVRLDKIDSAGQHVLAIINDVLDVAKIEAGRVQLDNTDFDLGALLDNVLAIIAEPAHQKGLAVTVNTSGVPAWLHGDPTRLRQAWLNCASNAVKFTEQGSVALSALLLQEDGDSLQLQFSVDDTGYRMAPEPLRRLFQDFEQADASTTRQYGGTGLGLAIRRLLAQLIDGEVGAPSTLGAASRFWFTARLGRGQGTTPLARSVERTGAPSRPPRPWAPRPVIRALAGWANVPIVALTANAFEDNRLACEQAGVNDLIVKPMQVSLLYDTLLKWLDVGAAYHLAHRLAHSGATADAHAQPQATAVQALLDQLDHLLALSDAAALTLHEAHAAALRQALGAPGDLLAHQVRQFAFDRALKTLRRLRS